MAASEWGRIAWSLKRDSEGHREYDLQMLVKAGRDDGPLTVMFASGLPADGTTWGYGGDNDVYAYLWPDRDVSQFVSDQGPMEWWKVGFKFSTRPHRRCQTTQIENPINEPPDLSGSFLRYVKNATQDRFGTPLRTSSHELITGEAAQFDGNRATVRVGLNTATLPLTTFTSMMNTVNDATLWGLGSRKIKLSNTSWQRKVYGTCNFYYTSVHEFDIDFEGHDKVAFDQGTRILIDGGDADNPADFILAKDKLGENYGTVLLDGAGQVLTDIGSPVTANIEHYNESNFLLLGVPTSL